MPSNHDQCGKQGEYAAMPQKKQRIASSAKMFGSEDSHKFEDPMTQNRISVQEVSDL
jgi:hypothetical protein